MDMLFDPEKNWTRFRDIMSDKLTAENDRLKKANQPSLPEPSADDWKVAREPFIAGVLSGLKRVDTRLGGMSWLRTKATFKAPDREAREGHEHGLDELQASPPGRARGAKWRHV
jgi:hypothetical protein